jgi:amino acid adenylation domain-containing protein
LEEVVRRHEAWRTSFEEIGGEGRQVVRPPPRFSLPVRDLSTLTEADRDAEAQRIATEEARRPLGLSGPLVRAKLVRIAPNEHRLYVIVHQIIHDGISVYSVFLPELAALYEAFAAGMPSPLAELSVQYPDYAAWQRGPNSGAVTEASLAYWRRQLSGGPAPLEIPTDRPRPAVQSFRGGQHTFRLSQALTSALKRLSQREEATLFATLVAAFKILLYRYSGQDDIAVGTAISTRRLPEVETLLGVFLNTIVLRTQLAEESAFREVLARVKRVIVDGLSHGDVPFHRLVRDLQPRRDPGRNPLFQVTFVLEPPMPPPRPGWVMTQMDADTGISRVDLYLQMDDRPEGLVGHIRYNSDLWQHATIVRLAEHFERLLEGITADPGTAISAIPMSAPIERGGVPNASERGPSHPIDTFPPEEIEQSIPARFAKQASQYPDRIAARDGRTQWTYAQLNGAANRVAHALARAEVPPHSRVALLLDHDVPMLAGVLGVLKGGSAYVPLDPTHPEERLRLIALDAGCAAVVASRRSSSLAHALVASTTPVLLLDDLLEAPNAPEYGHAASADGLAYLLYTSGSTGRPKGVSQTQRNVLHFIAAYSHNLGLSPDDRLALLASYSVDAAVMDIFGALLNGAALCPIDVREVGLAGVHARLAEDAVTVYHSTPTLYRHVVGALAGKSAPATIRLVVLGGEEARSDDAATWRQRFAPHCALVNGYGPTESTVSLQYFVDRGTSIAGRSLPIGRPVDRTSVALLSPSGRPGQVYGEIAIRSPYVALGYWGNDELTDQVFLGGQGSKDRVYRTGDMGRLLHDGNIEFRGRRDLQTKIRGFRVEVGDVEAALSQHPDIGQVAARVWESEEGDRRLVAYFVARKNPAPSGDELRAFLRRKLPLPMIPAAFVARHDLPLTPSGKVDRLALPVPDVVPAREMAEPTDATERQVGEIWKRLLGVSQVDPRDDFFDLGGDSLLALRMMSEISQRFGVNLALATLFESPTIERLALALTARATDRGTFQRSSTLVPLAEGGGLPAYWVPGGGGLSLLMFREASRGLSADRAVLGFESSLSLRDAPDDVPTLAKRYVTDLHNRDPEGPYVLLGFSSGGWTAFEMTRQIEALGGRVALLVIFDTDFPRALTLPQVARSAAYRAHYHATKLLAQRASQIVPYAKYLARFAQAKIGLRPGGVEALPKEEVSEDFRELDLKNRRILLTYSQQKHPPVRAKIAFVQALTTSKSALPADLDPRSGWSALTTGGFEVIRVEGSHLSMLRPPHLDDMLGKIRELLARVDAPSVNGS